MSQKVLGKDEKKAMAAVRREVGGGVSAEIFAVCWQRARDGDLQNLYLGQIAESASARAEAADAVRAELADVAREAQEFLQQNDDGGIPPRPRPNRDEEAGQDIKLADATVLRSEAMALLVAELAGERADVRDYRTRYFKGGVLSAQAMDRYLDILAYMDTLTGDEQENERDELEEVAGAVCDAFGVEIWDALDIIIAGHIRRSYGRSK